MELKRSVVLARNFQKRATEVISRISFRSNPEKQTDFENGTL